MKQPLWVSENTVLKIHGVQLASRQPNADQFSDWLKKCAQIFAKSI